jgi:phosphate-selective porin OprO/OprP
MSRRLSILALLPLAATVGQAVAQEVSVESVDQRLRILERKLELEKEDADAKAKAATTPAAAASGFSLTSGDKNYALQFRFLGQLDYRQFFNDDKAANGNTFTLRRVRPTLAGSVGKNVEFQFTPEFAGGDPTTSQVTLLDVWASYKVNPAFGIKAGKYTLPVVVETGSNRHFNESPYPNFLAQNRDLGIELFGSPNAFIDYRLGVFNGVRNEASGNTNADFDNKKTIAGRLTLKPLAGTDGALKPLALSLGFSTGKEIGTPNASPNQTLTNVNSVSRRAFFNFGTANTINGTRTRISPAATLYSGPFSAVAEYITEKGDYSRYNTATPAVAVASFTAKNEAWRATVGYVLTGEASSGNVNPKKPFTPGGDGWGAFEVAAFASGIDFDDELFANFPGTQDGGIAEAGNARLATSFGLAGNWYLTRNISVRLNLEETRFHKAFTRDTEKAASLRLQVQY